MAGLRVLVIGGDRGAAPLTAAHTLANRLGERPEVEAVELIADPSALGSPSARRLSRGLPGRAGALAGAVLGHRSLAAAFNAVGAHVVVSESPGLSAVLGQLRALGRLPLPLVALVPDGADPAGWAARGVDMHLLLAPDAVADVGVVEAVAGPGTATAVQPLVDPAFLDAPARGASRGYVARQLNVSLKGGRPLVLISADGDGDGSGAAAAAAAEAAEVALDTVADAVAVVIAGDHPERVSELETRFATAERVRVLGVAERRATLLAAADVLIDTAGGTAALEARLVGCPLISFGPGDHSHDHDHGHDHGHDHSHIHGDGHLGTGAAGGGAECAHSGAELGPVLSRVLERERPTPPALSARVPAADVVIATAFGAHRRAD